MQPQGENDYWQPGKEEAAPHSSTTAITPAPAKDEIIIWQASEAIHHEKEGIWYATLFGVAIMLIALSVFVIQSITFTILIVVMVVGLVVIARRPARIMRYSLSSTGLQIDNKPFHFHEFRSFGIVEEGPIYSAVLIPVKRFMPAVTVYFPAENGEAIVDILGDALPMEHVKPDFLDKITSQLRF